ncbi:MAG: DUF1697 domain-containing protein [Chitinophagaceae bacterium]|nr:DUF1697 domain-containing protein [Chitinophagaceae bacterium]
MSTHIALLRGINVGGNRLIKMDALKALFINHGFTDVKTYIQSGNVIFNGNIMDVNHTTIQLEQAIQTKFGVEVPVMIKTIEQWENIIQQNPFVQEHGVDEKNLHVTLLGNKPTPASLKILPTSPVNGDAFSLIDETIYLHCQNPYHQTKLSNAFFEKTLGVKATTRNWKTILKIGQLIT